MGCLAEGLTGALAGSLPLSLPSSMSLSDSLIRCNTLLQVNNTLIRWIRNIVQYVGVGVFVCWRVECEWVGIVDR